MAETRRPRGGYYPGDWVRPRPNPGGWTPIADTQEIHTGNRSTNRAGAAADHPAWRAGRGRQRHGVLLGLCGLIELPDGSWGSLYAGSSWLHNAGRPAGAPPAELRWATWRPHRLCGVEAPVEGRCTIPTVYRTRDEFRLNYRCRPGGWISVELLYAVPSRIHADVEPVPGFTFADCGRLTGDAEDALITWNGRSDISPVREMVGIRLRLFQATVFAYAV